MARQYDQVAFGMRMNVLQIDQVTEAPPASSDSSFVRLYMLGGVLYYVDASGNSRAFADLSQAQQFAALVDLTANTFGTEAGTGITAGTGTVYASAVERVGGLIRSSIILDLTGLHSTGANDIIGIDGTANPCHLGQFTAARNGTPFATKVTCLETPAGGDPDIDFYTAVEATGVEDGLITDLDETKLINHGDWAFEQVDYFDTQPVANGYLYAVAGAATDADYTAGKFLIESFGY